MNTVEILKKAKERIGTPDRWYQGAMYDPFNKECLCLVGAMREAMSLPVDRHLPDPDADFWCKEPVVILKSALPNSHSPSFFNDNPCTTHADIMALFDRAIAEAEAGQ